MFRLAAISAMVFLFFSSSGLPDEAIYAIGGNLMSRDMT